MIIIFFMIVLYALYCFIIMMFVYHSEYIFSSYLECCARVDDKVEWYDDHVNLTGGLDGPT